MQAVAFCKAQQPHQRTVDLCPTEGLIRGRRGELHAAVTALAVQMASMRGGVEACQDYMAVRGLRLWQQEFAAVVRWVAVDSLPGLTGF